MLYECYIALDWRKFAPMHLYQINVLLPPDKELTSGRRQRLFLRVPYISLSLNLDGRCTLQMNNFADSLSLYLR